MDLQQEDLQFLTMVDIIRESVAIPRQSGDTFKLITLTLIFPLSFGILAHSLFTHRILMRLEDPNLPLQAQSHQWALLLSFQFLYLLFLFAFSLLSTAAVVFTVASLYSGKPLVSFSSLLSAAVPSVFCRLFLTFLWVSLLMLLYNVAFVLVLVLILIAVDEDQPLLFLVSLFVAFSLFLVIHVYIIALWHLASVVSVLEPFYGFSAMKKSYELLKGRLFMAAQLVFAYLFFCSLINTLFGAFIINGSDSFSLLAKFLIGSLLLAVLILLNLVGLLVQSVFYYVCKSFHHQDIDKTALYDHLGGYLGEYVPLKSNIQMETLDI